MEIMKGLTEYADMATDDMKATKKQVLPEERYSECRPKDTGKYAKRWTTKTTKRDIKFSFEVTVYSPSKYQLSTFIEFGHAKRGGGRTKAQPHIAPAEERGVETLSEKSRKH